MKQAKALPPTAQLTAILKTEYQKQGVSLFFYNFSSADTYALAFEIEIGGEIIKAVFCNGKLRRRMRRNVVRAALLAFRFDYLQEMTIGDHQVRGVIFSPKEAEVQNA